MKTIVIAGANSAVARSLIEILAANDYTVVTISRGAAPPGSSRHMQVAAYHRHALPDWTEPVHGLVYLPGTIRLKPFHRITAEEFEEDLHVNTLGAVAVMQHFLPGLQLAGQSSVVLVSSVAARTGMPFHASVSLAKSALEGLTTALAAEYAPAIRFNAVAPSLMHTGLGEKFLNTEEKQENARKRNPMKHIGQPQDLAAMIACLLSDSARWVTGQVIAVDGGMGTLRQL